VANFSILSSDLTSRLATSPDPLQRKWVFPQIRRHPDQFHRDLLAALLSDDDESVRKSAEEVSNEIEFLGKSPLPKLK